QAPVPGAIVTDCLGLGCHTILLEVSDGHATCQLQTNICVISACQAVEQIIANIDASSLPRNRKQPLSASLKAACASFDKGHFVPALNQLEAFQNKVSAQIAPDYPSDAVTYIQQAQKIIDSINCAALLGLSQAGQPGQPGH
ncbi:hypothetical protein, partial [Raoultella ornithinolytica]|uniref:hypothetical protein n=1 Tax=Raoultella ornithinolytica TaxID=54291 RepID=UPI0013C33083